jgi:hypothetical protein
MTTSPKAVSAVLAVAARGLSGCGTQTLELRNRARSAAGPSAADIAIATRIATGLRARATGALTGAEFIRTTLEAYEDSKAPGADGISMGSPGDAVLVVELIGHMASFARRPAVGVPLGVSAVYSVYDIPLQEEIAHTSIGEPVPGYTFHAPASLDSLAPSTAIDVK